MCKAMRVQDERFFSKSLAELNFFLSAKADTAASMQQHEADLSDTSNEAEHLLSS